MNIDHPSARWLRRLQRDGQPIYLALVQALDAAIREGELQPGDQLPPQRTVAELLGVDFTTVTRAYSAARARGLIDAAVGRGTFVRALASEEDAGLADLSMNLPPPPLGVSLGALLKDTTRTVLDRADPAALMAYHPGAGTLGQKTAAAAWLRPCLGDVGPQRISICPGAQAALTAVLAAFTAPGDRLIVEPLTYPGLIAAARSRGLRLIACPTDGEGFIPEALERLCALELPVALYLVPTTQNPTASTMGHERRADVARIAVAAGVWLIEDDPYSRLFDAPLPALASLAPDRAIYIATLSKCLSPGLRTAFVVAPAGDIGDRLAESLRATALFPAPLMTAVVTSWIREGAAEVLLDGVRREARARRAIAARLLPKAEGAAESIHVWLNLPGRWEPERLRALAQARGLALVTDDSFAVGETHRHGVRISLGATSKRSVLEEALTALATVVAGAGSSVLV